MIKLTPAIAKAAIEGFQNQIAELQQFLDGGIAATVDTPVGEEVKKNRGMTAAGRKILSDNLKRRWAEKRLLKSQTDIPVTPIAAPKRKKMSVANRKRMAEGQARRWAKFYAEQRKNSKTMAAAG